MALSLLPSSFESILIFLPFFGLAVPAQEWAPDFPLLNELARGPELLLLSIIHSEELMEVVLGLASLDLLLPLVEMLWLVLPHFVPQDVSLDVAVAVGPSCPVSRGPYLLAATVYCLFAWKLQVLADGTIRLSLVVRDV